MAGRLLSHNLFETGPFAPTRSQMHREITAQPGAQAVPTVLLPRKALLEQTA